MGGLEPPFFITSIGSLGTLVTFYRKDGEDYGL